LNRTYHLVHFYLASALAHRGKIAEARSEVEEGLAVGPGFTIQRFRAGDPSSHSTYLAHRIHVAEGMRKAGVPEG
jgi:hypothetical protein